MKPFKFRASSIGLIMSDAQSIDAALLTPELQVIARKTKKTDEEKALLEPFKVMSLSAGAKTYCEQIAKEFVYGYTRKVTTKYMEKGIDVEQDSIDLYNSVSFTSLEKNTERRSNDWLTGEPDLVDAERIVDIKSSWSLDTFPVTAESAKDTLYEWQGRAYMLLWEKPSCEIAHCLVDTPGHLIGYEEPELHEVSHIQPELRVTRVRYERDADLERRMQIKAEAANRLIQSIVKQIAAEHS